jgi:hypothetical protein
MSIIDHHQNRRKEKCNDDKLLVLMSTHKGRKGEKKRDEDSILNNTVQMDLFIYSMYMRDSSSDAVNEKETETEH